MTPIRSFAVAALCALFTVTQSLAQVVVKGVPIGGADANALPPIERKIDAKAKAIYHRAKAETAKLDGVQFDGQMRFEGGTEGINVGMPEEVRARKRYRIRFVGDAGDAKPGMLPPHAVRIETLDGPQQGRVLVLNGGKLRQIDDKAKTFIEASGVGASGFGGGSAQMLWAMAASACPEWYRGMSAPVEMGEPVVLELVGTATVDDLECDLVKVVREIAIGVVDGSDEGDMRTEKMPMTETIAFARADGLPRRFGMEFPGAMVAADGEDDGEDGGEDGGEDDAMPAMPTPVVTLVGLKVYPKAAAGEAAKGAGPKLDDALFALETTEALKEKGFKEVEFEMPGFPIDLAAGDGGDAKAMPAPPGLTVKVGDPAPDFKLTDLDGKEVTLASLKGKVVLLDFWATWCGPCVAAMPTMQKLHDEYQSKGVVVLGVNTWEQMPQAAKDYIAKKNYTYGCLLKGDELAEAYGVPGIPTLVVIGKDGKVVEIEVGLADPSGAGLRKVLDAALGGK
jgi:thiol-disulfide isomerase/thioredoxin